MIGFGIDLYPNTSILSFFEDVEGIEGEDLLIENFYNDIEDPQQSKYRIKLIKGTDINCFKENLKIIGTKDSEGFYYQNNGYVYVLNKAKKIKQSFFISDFEIFNFEILDNNRYNVIIDGILHKAEIGTKKIWNIRLNEEISEFDIWTKLKKNERQAWLETALNFQKKLEDQKGLNIQLKGKLIIDEDTFFCTLGEAINGPGGYFGRNLMSLDDCFTGGFGVQLPLTIMWLNHEFSKQKLGKSFEEIIKVFEINNVEIILA
ncbi:MAG: barstar family protein [Flavobacterium circumlabens]|uniref:barstar family protein n=1 Tax=Flavobacterium circumlabens TaxID=2133765 RepID=UPI0032671E01